MITTLIKKELIDHFLEGKIQILCFTIIVLVFVTTLINMNEYKKQNENYQNQVNQNLKKIKENKVFATIELKALRPPEIRSIICRGIENKVGNEFIYNFNDIPIKAKKSININQYTLGFHSLDISTIFIWIISLFGFLLSYDCVSKEKEEGTLRLLLTSNASRASILISKIISSIIVVSIIIFASFFSITILLITSPSIDFDVSIIEDFTILMFVFILYGTFWVLIGTTLSIISVSSATSLIGAMAVWIFLLIILPGILTLCIGDTMLLEDKREISKTITTLDESFHNSENNLFDRNIQPIINAHQFVTMGGGTGSPPVWFPNEKTKEAMLQYFIGQKLVRDDYAKNKFRLEEKKYLLPLKNKNKLSTTISMLSPMNMTEIITQKVCKTSYDNYFNFIDQFLLYRNLVNEFLYSKNAYNSYLWFTPNVDRFYENARSDPKLNIDLDNIPVFQYNKYYTNALKAIALPIVLYLFFCLAITVVNIYLSKKMF